MLLRLVSIWQRCGAAGVNEGNGKVCAFCRIAASLACKHSSPILSIVPGAIPLPYSLIRKVLILALLSPGISGIGQDTICTAHHGDMVVASSSLTAGHFEKYPGSPANNHSGRHSEKYPTRLVRNLAANHSEKYSNSLSCYLSVSHTEKYSNSLSNNHSASHSEKYSISRFKNLSASHSKNYSDSPFTNLSANPSNKRIAFVAGAHAALWVGSYWALNEAWYADYPKTSFHFFNDNREWNQVDKAGHLWTTYQVSRLSAALWKWSGCNQRTSTWLGGLSGIAYQSIIEIQDGFSSKWGFSWGDMAANVTGAALFVSQQLGWQDQRIVIKMGYWPYDYNMPDLVNRRNQLFGKSTAERLLKDYNSQSFWISANLQSFFPNSKLPTWLNIAAGYKSEGMLGGFENKWTDKEGNPFDRTDIARVRRFFIAPDIDLTRIRTNSKWVRSILSVLNVIKIPAPALEWNGKGKLRAHALFF